LNEHLDKLYREFDQLYRDIGIICAGCKDYECEGYVWLLAEEAETLYNQNIPIVEINEDMHFVHSFEEVDGRILIDKPKPPCILRANGLCTIYGIRPLVCRMYPVGFEYDDGLVRLVLHEDCQFARELQGEDRRSFFQAVIGIFQSVPQELIRRLNDEYAKVYGISIFPEGPNLFEAIASIDSLLTKGGDEHVKVQTCTGLHQGDQDHRQGEEVDRRDRSSSLKS